MRFARAEQTAAAIAARLADPRTVPATAPAQSLGMGAAGIALLHIERARTSEDAGAWGVAHTWLQAAVADGIDATADTNLFYGAPALAFAVSTTGSKDGRYHQARSTLNRCLNAIAHRRVQAARTRIDHGKAALSFSEFDVIRGLTGIGAALLRTDPGSSAMERLLAYLVRLADPVFLDGQPLPGWWVQHDPWGAARTEFAGGHANFGMAHGITGPLSLLSLAYRKGISVKGQIEAISRIGAWLDTWRQESPTGVWWPAWITREEQRTRHLTQSEPLRPSWCYGTPGIARAQQLAGIATGDITRQRMAEQALSDCLRDPAQLAQVTDTSLCHGWAGLFQTTWRAARDAREPEIAAHLRPLADLLLHRGELDTGGETGLLEGDTGLALALHTAAHATSPVSGWDAFLLIH